MLPDIANIVVALLGLYVAAGALFALPFVFRGVNRIDPVAREGTWGFRLIIVPGVVALWPLLAWRWVRGRRPQENNAHRRAAREGAAR